MDINVLKAELSAIQLKASALSDNIKSGGLSDAESRDLNNMADRAVQLKAQITHLEKHPDGNSLVSGGSRAGDFEAFGFDNAGSFGAVNSGHMATDASTVKAALRNGGQKSLVATGSSVVPLDLRSEVIIKGRETLVGVVNFLTTTVRTSSAYRFIREATVDNQADLVETGGTKPESDYGVESVDGTLKFLAHVSQPVDQDALDDAANLESYLTQAMSRGIYEKLGGKAVAAMQTATGAQTVAAGAEPWPRSPRVSSR